MWLVEFNCLHVVLSCLVLNFNVYIYTKGLIWIGRLTYYLYLGQAFYWMGNQVLRLNHNRWIGIKSVKLSFLCGRLTLIEELQQTTTT